MSLVALALYVIGGALMWIVTVEAARLKGVTSGVAGVLVVLFWPAAVLFLCISLACRGRRA